MAAQSSSAVGSCLRAIVVPDWTAQSLNYLTLTLTRALWSHKCRWQPDHLYAEYHPNALR
jgi:hypothetical protein